MEHISSIFVLIKLLVSQALATEQSNLTFMLITSFGQFGFNSSGVIPAADMALEGINNDPNILEGYKLVYDQVRDSQVCQFLCIIAYIRLDYIISMHLMCNVNHHVIEVQVNHY